MDFKKKLKKIKKRLPTKQTKMPHMAKEKQPMEANCICKDKKGDFKKLYTTQDQAIKQAQEVWLSKGLKLKSYPCPYTLGWHLSQT
ncbi:MAG: hypothetical protein U9N49_09365 [Campylobacterota bacterium]|nr:hypothetical protein [Campylobacterota bacterium]